MSDVILDARRRRRLRALADTLVERHGPQGWWPVRSERALFATRGGARQERGYHPGESGFPRGRAGRWEIAAGAVLTQNTAWSNVERALDALAAAGVGSPEAVEALTSAELAALIRPAGYYHQKSGYLRALADWFRATDGDLARAPRTRATLEAVRPTLLAVRGVGPETADSVLLYGYALPTFVIDAYTRRVLGAHGLVAPAAPYEALRAACEASLREASDAATVERWQEIHAVIVEEAKATRGDAGRRAASRRAR